MLACNATPYPIVLDTKDNAATHITFQVIYQLLLYQIPRLQETGINNKVNTNKNDRILVLIY